MLRQQAPVTQRNPGLIPLKKTASASETVSEATKTKACRSPFILRVATVRNTASSVTSKAQQHLQVDGAGVYVRKN